MLGRYQEAYIQAFSNWYKATLDPKTGRPPAFDGYWAMNIGMPGQDFPMPQTRMVGVRRDDYETSLPRPQPGRTRKNAAITPAATAQILSRKKIINGIEYTSREVIYPRLPPRPR